MVRVVMALLMASCFTGVVWWINALTSARSVDRTTTPADVIDDGGG
jgi:hypothetical protein